LFQFMDRKRAPTSGHLLRTLKRVFAPWGNQRAERMNTLLSELARDTTSLTSYKLVSELTVTTGLNDTALPLLADLKRRGLVEQEWLNTENGPKLAYRLTPGGLEYARRS
jgi:Transcriptional regulator PadR-like family